LLFDEKKNVEKTHRSEVSELLGRKLQNNQFDF